LAFQHLLISCITVSFIEYKAIQSHSKSFRNVPWMPNTSSKSGQRLMGSQERVGEFKCGFICSDSLEIKGSCKLLNSCVHHKMPKELWKRWEFHWLLLLFVLLMMT